MKGTKDEKKKDNKEKKTKIKESKAKKNNKEEKDNKKTDRNKETKVKKELKPKREKISKKKAKPKKEKTKTTDENQENIEVFSINLSVLIALFIVLIIIIGTIVYLYLKPSQKEIRQPINQETIENKTETKTPKPVVEFDTETQMKQVNEYLRIKSIAMSNPQSLLETYGFATNQKFGEYSKTEDETFIKTDISYEAIRNALQSHITKELFANEFKNIYKQSNGVTHVANISNPREYYEIKRHEKLDTKGKPVIQVWYTTKVDGEESGEKSMKIEFSTYNGRWLISSIK